VYVTKAGQSMKIDEDTLPHWQAQGWSVDGNRDSIPDPKITVTASAPTSPVTGDVWIDTTGA
jgi:hypothetical protein